MDCRALHAESESLPPSQERTAILDLRSIRRRYLEGRKLCLWAQKHGGILHSTTCSSATSRLDGDSRSGCAWHCPDECFECTAKGFRVACEAIWSQIGRAVAGLPNIGLALYLELGANGRRHRTLKAWCKMCFHSSLTRGGATVGGVKRLTRSWGRAGPIVRS